MAKKGVGGKVLRLVGKGCVEGGKSWYIRKRPTLKWGGGRETRVGGGSIERRVLDSSQEKGDNKGGEVRAEGDRPFTNRRKKKTGEMGGGGWKNRNFAVSAGEKREKKIVSTQGGFGGVTNWGRSIRTDSQISKEKKDTGKK